MYKKFQVFVSQDKVLPENSDPEFVASARNQQAGKKRPSGCVIAEHLKYLEQDFIG